MILSNTTNNKKVSLARERLFQLAIKTIGVVPQLEEPSFEQKQFFNRKMKRGKWT